MKKIFNFVLAMLVVYGVACVPENGGPGDIPSTSMTFTVDITDITSSTATVSVTPSNSDTYYFDVFKKADYDQYGGDSQFLEYWQADIKSYIEELNNQGYNITIANFVSSGNDMFTYEGNYALEPNTEYYAFAFGLSTGGRITTDVTKKAFKTLAVSEGGDKCIDNLVWGRVTGYGDEYSVGAKNWVIVLYDETRTSEFDIELQTELSATELPLGEYPINSTMSAGTAIAGADDEGYYGTFWKNSVETVFCKSGTVVLGKEGDNYTIRVEALDGNGNAITMSYTGELEKIAYDF